MHCLNKAMEDNFRPRSPPDLAAADRCRNELTRTYSYSDSSSVTVDNSKARPYTPWTDEKHNSYLNGLEVSFVKQLHHSFGLLSWCSKLNTSDRSPSQQLPVNASYSSDQFTVLREGSRQKINFEREQALPHSAAGTHAVVESPWIRHFTCSDKHSTKKSVDLQECSMFHRDEIPLRGKRIFSHGLTSLGQRCLCHKCHQHAIGTIAEVSDQNFVDEDREEKSSSLSKAKKLKKSTTTNDQIVPSGDPFTAKTSTSRNALPERGEQVHHECLPENVESLVCPENDVKSFLRHKRCDLKFERLL
ncbi:unnamed protein product [Camellia sinensis]